MAGNLILTKYLNCLNCLKDEFGNSEYGYRNINSAKHEVSSNGIVRGSYSYLDDSGHHTVNYVADDWGFRLV